MRSYPIIFIFLVLKTIPLLLYSQQQVPPFRVDLFGSMNSFKNYYLSEVADEVEYVKFETLADGMIAYGNIQRLGDYFVVSDWRKPVMIFSIDGKYIRSIGRFGNGPSEYSSAYAFDIDQVNQLIYILRRNSSNLFAFNLYGDLVKNLSLPYFSANLCVFESGRILVETHNNNKDDGSYPLCVLSPEGELIREVKRPDLPARKTLGYNPIPSFERIPSGQILISNFARDTIYQINDQGALSTYAILDLGKLKLPDKMYYDMQNFVKGDGLYNYIVGPGCRLVGRFLKINHSLHRETNVGLFDLNSGEMNFLNTSETEGKGFINDLDGGPTFWTHVHDQKCYYQRVNALDLIENRDLYASQAAKYPEKQKVLLKLIDSLKPEDNPILMIVKLKNLKYTDN